jgi:hypothetical protein
MQRDEPRPKPDCGLIFEEGMHLYVNVAKSYHESRM